MVKQLEVILGVLADFASISIDGKLNILGVFSQVNPPALPFALPLMHLVISYEAGQPEANSAKSVRILLMDEDGVEVLSIEQQMTIGEPPRPGARTYFNQIVALAGVRFEKPGDYAFAVLIQGEERKRIPLHVSSPPKGSTA